MEFFCLNLMSHKRPETLRKLNVHHQRMRSRTEHMRTANRLGICTLVIVMSVILPITALPRLKSADKREAHLNTYWAGEVSSAIDTKDKAYREYRAVEQDPRYLEIKARERLHWSHAGETIFVFPADKE